MHTKQETENETEENSRQVKVEEPIIELSPPEILSAPTMAVLQTASLAEAPFDSGH